ncbi:uncharacterized protein LOC100187031 [Ciona intestinalis]
MTICSFQFQKQYLKSLENVFKILEILLCGGCWCVIYLGNVMAESNTMPSINDEVMVFTLCSLPAWILTCLTYVLFLFTAPRKQAMVFDLFLNSLFCAGLAFAVGFAGTKKAFLWHCINKDGEQVDIHYCSLPDFLEIRNGGENMAVLVLGTLSAAVYFTHMIFMAATFCTTNALTMSGDNRGIFQSVT